MSIFRPRGLTVTAELSCSHVGSLDRALRLISDAKECGADAAKIQSFGPGDMTISSTHPAYKLHSGPWAGRGLWDLYAAAATPYLWLDTLFAHADAVGIPLFASVFSRRGLDRLEDANCPVYKIASAEVADTRFVELVASVGKPVIISDGMATPSQMAAAMKAVPKDRLTVLKCVSEYPAKPDGYNLATLRVLQQGNIRCGISDHTTDRTVPVMAATLGCDMLEKHLMAADNAHARPLDYEHSLSPFEFRMMVRAVRDAEAAMGSVVLGASEEAGKGWRRRLVAARDLQAGHTLSSDDIAIVRCGAGLEPDTRYVGRVLMRSLLGGEPITWETLGAGMAA